MYARLNAFGMIETPYARVKDGKITKDIQYLNALEEENSVSLTPRFRMTMKAI